MPAASEPASERFVRTLASFAVHKPEGVRSIESERSGSTLQPQTHDVPSVLGVHDAAPSTQRKFRGSSVFGGAIC